MSSLITPQLVTLDVDLGTDRADVIRALATRVVEAGRATDVEALFTDAWAREQKTDTGIPGGIAIPHCRSTAVLEPTFAMARPNPAIDFGAPDGPADLIFLIAAPDGADQAHLKLLSKLARSLIKPDFVAALRSAPTPEDIVALVEGALSDEPAPTGTAQPVAPAAAASASSAPSSGAHAAEPAPARPTLVAVTACPTGIAHTYMAADALVAAAERAGVNLQVETQGSSGAKPLDPSIIAAAGAVIFAVDVDVRDKGRFAGMPLIQSPVKRGIDAPDAMIAEAVAAATNPNARRVGSSGQEAAAESQEGNEHFGKKLQRWLLTGVSYMIPFVAGGGLLMALGFLLGGYEIANTARDFALNYSLFNLPEGGLGQYLGAVLFLIGNVSINFLVPVLAGYIAYAIADRPGIAPGFTVGAIALLMNAGFIGGLIGGLLAGGAAYAIGRLQVPAWLRGLMPVVIIPLLASLVASGLMLLVLGGPIALLMTGLSDWLSSLTGASAVLLGLILGVMMGADLGGPINKVAYAFAVAGLGAGSFDNQTPWMIMAAVMGAGMVAPLGMALASTVLARKQFSALERNNGVSAWALGASFISEGAIPFAAADPLRVIPASIVGSGVAGAIIMGTGVTSQAPHGGFFVFFAIGNFGMFVVAIAIGALVTALIVIALKRWAVKAPRTQASEPVSVPVAA
ncbi:PTS system D-fructose-specific IIA component (F1P-forming) (Frc family) /PTS system D-fructose-specific IIB component (F1P-forming) (Frc family) /PTS system D-fructose-specific IIC component (F1P-forming) (Frc family) [Glaciihabitans tibetensis]|uniref:PTS system D-fructose-specific IIA component (F1P-forming) (Frc family) /PTS system D-fructose-specific IIB component (F1P-forming) (Frc family) /PTS system D-fructose-specific IIC component (F1P-f... n=1 Tax=Glaciihabitans tibetensis TaxID=1266600 RepID=A0A2T0VK21_9MICO|nr:fructose-specific PTS transporter subunit EIIC [Glaciihabitans tibetensis]PRY70533.1 PTS system D-fructose-specific IIA component (F1P-forming) (Frc family) /PTS system D-fructose-specific IIB component (F1P-forming) (Frc family) /PTS system D-fructose-specific IIC component (F1P-forming) (Frc family) [Glaciihabitans tibetensis]